MSIASKCPVYPWRTCFSWTSPGQRKKLTDQSRPHWFTFVYHLLDSREQDDNNILVRTALTFTTQPRSALTFIAQLRLALTFTALFMSFHLLNKKYELCSLMESSPEPSTNGKFASSSLYVLNQTFFLPPSFNARCYLLSVDHYFNSSSHSESEKKS